MPPRGLGGVKHGHGTAARRDHHVIGKADPLAPALIEKLVANSRVFRFVLTPVRMDLLGDLWGQPVGNALQGAPRRKPNQ
jgi:hypothetical protein